MCIVSTRRRRLTVRARTGRRDGSNLVASYLDNELAAEEVAEFEKRCLTSDVHLAEVASVAPDPQPDRPESEGADRGGIGCIILIKGRESVAPRAPRALAGVGAGAGLGADPALDHSEPPRQQW